MANEAVIIELPRNIHPVMRTCTDTNYLKGAIMKIADPNTVSATSADGDAFGGIAAAEKVVDGEIVSSSRSSRGVKEGKARVHIVKKKN